MNDETNDYLWDGTGEVDAEVERLEGLLGRYRGNAPAPELPAVAPRLAFFPAVLRRAPQLTAALAATIAIAVGLTTWSSMQRAGRLPGETPGVVNGGGEQPTATGTNSGASGPSVTGAGTGRPQPPAAPAPTSNDQTSYQGGPRFSRPPAGGFVGVSYRGSRSPRATPGRAPGEIATAASASGAPASGGTTDLAAAEPARRSTRRFIDLQTADHLEQAALLLRTFRNEPVDGSSPDDLAYAKRRSRELLDQNVLLRRSAEAKGNLPAEDVLNSLEPYLLDIANLGDKPARSDVSAIRTRIEKKEIVDDLQLYAMNGPRLGF